MAGLNVNFGQAVGKFESAMQKKMLIRSVFYKRVFGGKGFEFDSFKTYSLGEDDSSLIDWKATMKNGGEPLVRRYIEERDLNIFLIIDVGSNMVFGSGDKLKAEMAAEIAAAISHLILVSGDKIGYALYSPNIVSIRPFSPGLQQFYSLLKNLINIKSYGGVSNLGKALEEIKPHLKKASAVIILSDFINMDGGSISALKNFAKRFETIGLMIRDEVDTNLANLKGEVIVEDIKTGEQLLIDPNLIQYEYQKHAHQQIREMQDFFKRSGIDSVEIKNSEDFILKLVDFLRRRIKKRRLV